MVGRTSSDGSTGTFAGRADGDTTNRALLAHEDSDEHKPKSAVRAASTGVPHRIRDAKVLSVVIMYAMSSLGGVFVNKACLSAFEFKHTITLMLAQLTVSVSALTALRFSGVIVIPQRELRELRVLIIPAVALIANVTVGLLALRLVNIPMFSAFRRLSAINVMMLEYLVLGKTASRKILYTVFVMVLGSFLAGMGDLTYDPLGYFLVFLNNMITAVNLVSIKKATQIVRLGALPLNYYVSCIALPIVFMLSIVTGELFRAFADIAERPQLQTTGFAIALSLSAASAFLINFFTNLCTQLTSPLTTAITGQMKNVLQTVLGIFAWGYKVSALNLAGLGVALVGSVGFAYLKYEDAMAARKAADKPSASEESDDATANRREELHIPIHHSTNENGTQSSTSITTANASTGIQNGLGDSSTLITSLPESDLARDKSAIKHHHVFR